jgi:imidazoleglycerol-phosphate dehydratase/histidinol-phosphatase
MKKVLFIDRDGTLIKESPDNWQIDSFEKLDYYPGVFSGLGQIARHLNYELVMVTNQDGLGTDSFPEEIFWSIQERIIQTFMNEGITFKKVFIDRSFPGDQRPTRKPGTGMLTEYMDGSYDLEQSFVIGDRLTDMELAKNLGARGIFLDAGMDPGKNEIQVAPEELEPFISLRTTNWEKVYQYLRAIPRSTKVSRKTQETSVVVNLNIDGRGYSDISTGLRFFDHMLDQVARHGSFDIVLQVDGDLDVDEHHTIEDTALALGQAFHESLGNKAGIERYGFCLPMDDSLAQVALDFGGRNWIEWDLAFKREYIGQVPTEMFYHFFKSFSDAALCNLNLKAEGTNEHHMIEALFKAFGKALKMAVNRNMEQMEIPSTKGSI